MKARPTVFVFGPLSLEYKVMFIKNGFKGSPNMLSADFLCLTGGADVCPALYAEKTMPATHCNVERDRQDIEICSIFEESNRPMVGICRGGQFLNVLCGGKLWQDVNNHGINGTHEVVDLETGEIINVTSTHHQMMRPNMDAQIVATANLATKKVAANDWWLENVKVDIGKAAPRGFCSSELFDTEVCFYQAKKALCFQPHPEFTGYPDCQKYFFTLLKRHFDLAVEAA